MSKAFRKILLVEPDKACADELRLLLSEDGHSIHLCETGEEAIARVQEDAPDLVLLNLILPDLGGYEVSRLIRSVASVYVPIIMIGHGKNYKNLARALNEGADDFVHRPFDNEELLARISTVFRWKEAQERLEKQTRSLQDLTRRYQEQVENLQKLTTNLQEFSIIDRATSLHAHSYYLHRLQEEVAKVQRHGGTFSCMRLCVTNVQDLLRDAGAKAVEQLAKLIGQTLSGELRTYDVPTRIGHADFAVLLQEASKENAARLAYRLRDLLYGIVFDHPELTSGNALRIAIGIAEFPVDADNSLDLDIRLEESLRVAKSEQEDTIYLFR